MLLMACQNAKTSWILCIRSARRWKKRSINIAASVAIELCSLGKLRIQPPTNRSWQYWSENVAKVMHTGQKLCIQGISDISESQHEDFQKKCHVKAPFFPSMHTFAGINSRSRLFLSQDAE